MYRPGWSPTETVGGYREAAGGHSLHAGNLLPDKDFRIGADSPAGICRVVASGRPNGLELARAVRRIETPEGIKPTDEVNF